MATKPKKVAKKDTDSIKEAVASKPRYNTLCIDGVKYKTLLTEKYKNRKKWEEPDPKKIYSEIPGTVIDIYVKEGQKAKEGDLMLILEAMKMKNKLKFPEDGVVKKIYVKENQQIPKGYLMVEMK